MRPGTVWLTGSWIYRTPTRSFQRESIPRSQEMHGRKKLRIRVKIIRYSTFDVSLGHIPAGRLSSISPTLDPTRAISQPGKSVTRTYPYLWIQNDRDRWTSLVSFFFSFFSSYCYLMFQRSKLQNLSREREVYGNLPRISWTWIQYQ